MTPRTLRVVVGRYGSLVPLPVASHPTLARETDRTKGPGRTTYPVDSASPFATRSSGMFEGVRVRVQVHHEAGSGHFGADCLEQYSSASVVSVGTIFTRGCAGLVVREPSPSCVETQPLRHAGKAGETPRQSPGSGETEPPPLHHSPRPGRVKKSGTSGVWEHTGSFSGCRTSTGKDICRHSPTRL